MKTVAFKIKKKIPEYKRFGIYFPSSLLVSLVAYLPSFLNLKKYNLDDTWTIRGEIEPDYVPVFIGEGCIMENDFTLPRTTLKEIEEVLYEGLDKVVKIECLGWLKKKYKITYNDREIIIGGFGRLSRKELITELIKIDFPEYYSGLLK